MQKGRERKARTGGLVLQGLGSTEGRMTAVHRGVHPWPPLFSSRLYALWEKQLLYQHGSLDLNNLSVVYKHPREQMCTVFTV